MVCVHARLIEAWGPLSKCLVSCIPQLKNSLKDNLCLDQGPDTENVPIMYLCHGMTPQVSALSLCSVLPRPPNPALLRGIDHTRRSWGRLSAADNWPLAHSLLF